MPRIKVLPPDLRNKIAAGEVIERPASVVKELIENSIDAGSTDIKIDVLYAGKRLIRVSDNGSGMDREDALLCFESHATSKLSTEDDLFNITTMGFRGEALPSIASVSKVRIVTGLRGSSGGISIEIAGGVVKEIRDSSSAGTSVEVRDLFFNLPARKKFLKTNSTELFHIMDTVTKESLSHPHVGFTLITDNKETISLPSASGIRERIMQVYGEEFVSGLLGISYDAGELRLTALVSNTLNFRNMRSHQFIFINTRPVKDASISSAVYKAYEGILPHDRHPVFFIYLDIDPPRVDVNVHPAKREVRFENKEMIYRMLLSNIQESVREYRSEYARPFSQTAEADIQTGVTGGYPSFNTPSALFPQSHVVAEPLDFPYMPSIPFIYLGETFVALSGKGGLTIVDHHAAHERILFERLLKGVSLNSHQLLFPRQVKVSHKEYAIILENTRLLNDFGIDISDFGHDTLIVRSLPDAIEEADLRGILSDAASCLLENIPPDRSLKEELAARIACHSSVRGRQLLNQESISGLISDLEKTEHPDQCPHGRPTRLFFSLEDLKKMFKRK